MLAYPKSKVARIQPMAKMIELLNSDGNKQARIVISLDDQSTRNKHA